MCKPILHFYYWPDFTLDLNADDIGHPKGSVTIIKTMVIIYRKQHLGSARSNRQIRTAIFAYKTSILRALDARLKLALRQTDGHDGS